jgi:hypothetical protein
MAKPKTLPWWLDGSESCELCTHPYALHTERRCAACDRASCEHCISIDPETGEVICHECAQAEEEG